MEHHSNIGKGHHLVTALFGDHQQSFDLMAGTTFAQLAEQLADLAQENKTWPVGISVVFAPISNTLLEGDSRRRPATSQLGANQ